MPRSISSNQAAVAGMSRKSTQTLRSRPVRPSTSRRTKSTSLRAYETKTSYIDVVCCWTTSGTDRDLTALDAQRRTGVANSLIGGKLGEAIGEAHPRRHGQLEVELEHGD